MITLQNELKIPFGFLQAQVQWTLSHFPLITGWGLPLHPPLAFPAPQCTQAGTRPGLHEASCVCGGGRWGGHCGESVIQVQHGTCRAGGLYSTLAKGYGRGDFSKQGQRVPREGGASPEPSGRPAIVRTGRQKQPASPLPREPEVTLRGGTGCLSGRECTLPFGIRNTCGGRGLAACILTSPAGDPGARWDPSTSLSLGSH